MWVLLPNPTRVVQSSAEGNAGKVEDSVQWTCPVCGAPHDPSALLFTQAAKASISSLHAASPFSFIHLSRSALMASQAAGTAVSAGAAVSESDIFYCFVCVRVCVLHVLLHVHERERERERIGQGLKDGGNGLNKEKLVASWFCTLVDWPGKQMDTLVVLV